MGLTLMNKPQLKCDLQKKKKHFENPTLASTLNRWKYWEILTCVDRFTVLRFTATGAPPAASRIRVLPMN
jgi:hypothetical protein